MEIKNGVAFKVPVKIADLLTGAGVTGVVFGTPVVRIQKQAGSAATKTLSSPDWVEVDSTNMPGVYDLLLSTSDTNTTGFLKYAVNVSGSNSFVGIMEVVDNFESDTYTRLGAPAGASLSADIVQVSSSLASGVAYLSGTEGVILATIGHPSSGSIAADLTSIKIDTIKSRKILEGKWKIDTSTDTFTVYDTDGVTALLHFDLKDNTGSPSSTQIFERDPS